MYSNDHNPPSQDHRAQPYHPPQYTENVQYYGDPEQAYDLSNGFSGLNISTQEPIARTHSAMSMRSSSTRQAPQHAATLPQIPYNHHPGTSYDNHYPQSQQRSQYSPSDPYNNNPNAYYQQYQQPQQQWAATSHDPLYAAASDILGLAPPPNPQAAPYGHPRPRSPAVPVYPGGSSRSSYSDSQSIHAPAESYATAPSDDRDFELRTPVQKAASRTQAGKAIDLNAPPFTKEYIDQYRQRIKADPDPEAHFLYAKYLIEAAKKFRTSAKDSRAGKKYSEFLIAEALKTVRRLATQGDAYDEAQFFLANCYGTGSLGLQVDHEKAYHLYLQAAKQNHAAAAYRVAVCNEIGAGTKREPPRAAAFYRKSASLGDTAAMYKLGMILLQGLLDEPRNPREAIGWLKRAAEQADEENPHALHELALLYEQPNSTLVPHDPIYAKQLYTQSAQLGYTPSQFKLGQCYEYGSLSCPVDPRRSIAWYTKAAEKGDAEAELALSGWYLTGSEGVLKQSDSEAYLWARRAANKGLSKAEYAVGYYAEVGIGIKQDIEFAKRWYMRAAAQGNKRAMNRLTEMKRMGNKRPTMARPTRQQAKDECIIS
ncbi:HCP-like protein [Coprinopsis marcescibilis]|uniref:HCP-like protein n=1 Tax=Coprinopsis marcescibilis TaxID=230819 RepID=A0A5C3KYU7_COPMA|nr:HCP-like protein [Coprinopsis marcescibilis]